MTHFPIFFNYGRLKKMETRLQQLQHHTRPQRHQEHRHYQHQKRDLPRCLFDPLRHTKNATYLAVCSTHSATPKTRPTLLFVRPTPRYRFLAAALKPEQKKNIIKDSLYELGKNYVINYCLYVQEIFTHFIF